MATLRMLVILVRQHTDLLSSMVNIIYKPSIYFFRHLLAHLADRMDLDGEGLR